MTGAAAAIGWIGAALLAVPVHDGPPVWIDLVVGEGELRLVLSGEPEPLWTCLGASDAPPTDERAAEDLLRRVLRAEALLRVDGEPVEPVLERVDLPGAEHALESALLPVRAELVLARDVPPRTLEVRWTRFDGCEWRGRRLVPVTVLRGSRVTDVVSLTPRDPSFTWHARDRGPRPIAPVVVEGAARGARVPVLSVLLVLVGAVVLVRTRRGHAVAGRAAAAVALLFAALAHDTGVVELPGGAGRAVALPTGEQALALFETLHGNLYAAFEAESEDEIYAHLAVSVDAELLDELYADVYESLVLREQGGAVCRIEEVRVTGRELAEPPRADPPRFRVDWAWTVDGLVAHQGHVHRRRNEYEALYDVRHDGESWKIDAVEVREHRRVDLPEAVSEPVSETGRE